MRASTCIYCGHPAQARYHVIFRYRGGTDIPINIVPVCKSCNSAKGGRPVEYFLRARPEVLARVRAYQAGDDVLTGLQPGQKPSAADHPPRVNLTMRLPGGAHDHLREMAFRARRSQHALVMEALNLLFEKHGKPLIALQRHKAQAMSTERPNVSVWPEDKPWPSGMMPPPVLTLEISALELEALIDDHARIAAEGHAAHDHNAGAFHEARASYLRQRLAVAAPHRLTPDRKGRA